MVIVKYSNCDVSLCRYQSRCCYEHYLEVLHSPLFIVHYKKNVIGTLKSQINPIIFSYFYSHIRPSVITTLHIDLNVSLKANMSLAMNVSLHGL